MTTRQDKNSQRNFGFEDTQVPPEMADKKRREFIGRFAGQINRIDSATEASLFLSSEKKVRKQCRTAV
jgi:hypothetical protein